MLPKERGAIRRKAAALRYRKTILKGLSIAKEQNIIEENKRPGTSSEYWFKPVEEWLPEPVVRITDIRTNQVLEFPKIQNTESAKNELQLTSNDGVVRVADDHEMDSNMLLFNKLLEEKTTTTEVKDCDACNQKLCISRTNQRTSPD